MGRGEGVAIGVGGRGVAGVEVGEVRGGERGG